MIDRDGKKVKVALYWVMSPNKKKADYTPSFRSEIGHVDKHFFMLGILRLETGEGSN